MSVPINSNVAYIFLGAILTFLATALVEVVKAWLINGRSAKNFKIFLRLELESINKTLAKIKAKYEASNYYDYMLLDMLDVGISNLEGSRKEGIFIKAEKKQEKFFDLITGLALYSKDARSAENVFSSEREKLIKGEESIFDNTDVLEKADQRKRNELSLEMIELKRQIDELIPEL